MQGSTKREDKHATFQLAVQVCVSCLITKLAPCRYDSTSGPRHTHSLRRTLSSGTYWFDTHRAVYVIGRTLAQINSTTNSNGVVELYDWPMRLAAAMTRITLADDIEALSLLVCDRYVLSMSVSQMFGR